MNHDGTALIDEELHVDEPHWLGRAAYPVVVCLLAMVQASLFVALSHHHYWVAVPLVLMASHLMHGAIIGFHEASHGLLRKNRTLNEIDGVVLGTLSFTSFSLYRAAHQTHHAHLGTERDEELWPFVKPDMPRWFRVLAAVLELCCGPLVTPLIFVRSFLRENSPIRSKKVRRRIWWEFALIAAFWTGVLCAVTEAGVWKYFLWMYVAPAWIAGNLQSWRKYVEHVGLTGSTVRSATRSIVAGDAWGKLVSFTLLHEPYHGVHHQRVGLPHAELPAHAEDLLPANEEEHPPFRNYGHAARHLMHCLSDPRVGAQWLAVEGDPHAKPDARVSTVRA
jgi:fatty acid desaturase